MKCALGVVVSIRLAQLVERDCGQRVDDALLGEKRSAPVSTSRMLELIR